VLHLAAAEGSVRLVELLLGEGTTNQMMFADQIHYTNV
jgi:hypothetical protein